MRLSSDRVSSACVKRPPSMSQRCMLWSCSTEYTSTCCGAPWPGTWRCRPAAAAATRLHRARGHGDAGAGGDGQGEAVHFDRTLHFDVEVVHDSMARSGSVTSERTRRTRRRRDGPPWRVPRRRAGDARRFRTGAVADGVTERVVHVLEAVDVQQHNGHPALSLRAVAARVKKGSDWEDR